MGVVLIHDYDFFHYSHIIPNLECAKYSAYAKKKKQIVTFSPIFEPNKYTQTFFRKDYDDGIYDTSITADNILYGGRAFSDIYIPFNLEMENIYPDFEIYDKYRSYFGKTKRSMETFNPIINATHVRISLDGKTLEKFPFDRLRLNHPCVIFHDYDLSSIPNSLDLLSEVNNCRNNGLHYRIGNKFPINIYDYQSLQNWLKLVPMGQCFYIQYNGVFTDEEIIDLIEHPALGLQQLVYNFSYGCDNEQSFIQDILPTIYKQTLYLRRNKKKILLNIDTGFFQTTELYNLMKLIDCFYGKNDLTYIIPEKQTLYAYCSSKHRIQLEKKPWIHFRVSREEARASFQFIRKNNYELFDMFYSIPSIIAKGGKLVNEWE